MKQEFGGERGGIVLEDGPDYVENVCKTRGGGPAWSKERKQERQRESERRRLGIAEYLGIFFRRLFRVSHLTSFS
jgi:hypothetical protein